MPAALPEDERKVSRNFTLSPGFFKRFFAYSKATRIKMSPIVEVAVEEYMERNPVKKPADQ